MAENQVWFRDLVVRKGSRLKLIWRTGCGVAFTKDFWDRTRGVLDLDRLNEIMAPYAPFATRQKPQIALFSDALREASRGADGSTVLVRDKDSNHVCSVDLT